MEMGLITSLVILETNNWDFGVFIIFYILVLPYCLGIFISVYHLVL